MLFFKCYARVTDVLGLAGDVGQYFDRSTCRSIDTRGTMNRILDVGVSARKVVIS